MKGHIARGELQAICELIPCAWAYNTHVHSTGHMSPGSTCNHLFCTKLAYIGFLSICHLEISTNTSTARVVAIAKT